MVASQFIVKLRDTFLSEDAIDNLWSPQFTDPDAPNRNALIAADIASAFRSLFMRNEARAAPEPGAVDSAAKRMKELIEETQWPENAAFPVPAPFNEDAFRRYEVGCAVAILMEAFHRGGPGGDPSNFPPTRPV
jgi:hypothetical protein